jgi:PadR family transcriptional regulator PadR
VRRPDGLSPIRPLPLNSLFAIIEEMPQRTYLGEMELMVLLAVVRLGDDAYGVPISKELLSLAGREVALGSIYAALDRIEQKGFVTSSLGDPTPERGGRAKRYFRVTPTGVRALRKTRTALTKLWTGIPLLEGGRL